MKALYGVVFIAIISSFASACFAADMELTLDDGRGVILHEDSTWGFKQFTLSEGDEEDLYITLDNNKTICLRSDDTWGYTKGQPPKKKPARELPSVQASGTATKPTLDVAVQAATDQAIVRAVDRIKQYTSKSASAQKYLLACVKAEVGEHGAEVSYNPGWTAQAKVALDKFQVKKIVTCVEEQMAAQTAATESANKVGK